MLSVLESLKKVPGVKGALLADNSGGVLASCMPDSFNLAVMTAIVEELNFNLTGFNLATGEAKLIDLRFEKGRVVIKPFGDSYLVVVCQPLKNTQFLVLSMNVAAVKLEKIIQHLPKPLKYLSDKVVEKPLVDAEQAVPKEKAMPLLSRPKLRSELLLERFQSEYPKK